MQKLILIVLLALASQTSWAQDTEPCKCCTEPYRQFDFWVGNWEAFGTNGKLAGTNNIKLLHDSCVIQENWASGENFTGTSYNYYNVETNKWHQTWVDNQGGSLQLSGELVNGKMVLSSEVSIDNKGNQNINRITWTPNEDGSVRQFWEFSKDNGKTWSVAFDGLYKLKKE